MPTPFQRSYATAYTHPAPYAVTYLSAFGGGGVGDSVPTVGDGAEVGAGKFPVEGAMVPKAPSKCLCGGSRSVWVYVIFRPLEVRRHLVNAPHEVRQ